MKKMACIQLHKLQPQDLNEDFCAQHGIDCFSADQCKQWILMWHKQLAGEILYTFVLNLRPHHSDTKMYIFCHVTFFTRPIDGKEHGSLTTPHHLQVSHCGRNCICMDWDLNLPLTQAELTL